MAAFVPMLATWLKAAKPENHSNRGLLLNGNSSGTCAVLCCATLYCAVSCPAHASSAAGACLCTVLHVLVLTGQVQ